MRLVFIFVCRGLLAISFLEEPKMAEMQLYYQTIKTSEGIVAYVDTGGPGFPIVLVHGNSCSSAVFKKQIAAFRHQYRVIAVDLLGHGRSSRPNNPDIAYTIPGYAKVLDEMVRFLGLKQFAVVGYSLGGNIVLQWSQLEKERIKGIMIICSAPIKYSEEALKAYPPYEGNYSACPDQLTEVQAKRYMSAGGFCVEDPSVYFMVEDAMKTDGTARAKMVASVLEGNGVDETKIVSTLSIPLAVVVGNEDSALGLDYIAHLNYRNLWRGKVEFMPQARHAIPLHQADQFNLLLQAFLQDVEEK